MKTAPSDHQVVSDIIDCHGLTPAQSGLLFHVLSEPGEHLFVERILCPLQGDIDLDALVQVWQTLGARHSSLRTGFITDHAEGPLQVVYRSAKLDIRIVDWSGLTPAAWSKKVETELAEEIEQDFNLQQPPLMRLKIARKAKDEILMIWCSHHLIVDGWSCWILLCEAAFLYLANRHGMLLDLPPCPAFTDYARWLAKDDRAGRHRAYWQAYFDGYQLEPYALSARSEQREFHQDHAYLSQATTAIVHGWQRHTHTALNTLLQAAWALVLAQEQELKQNEVLFGTVFSGRSSGFPGVTDVVGLLISVLPVRVPLQTEMMVSTWLDLLQQRHAEMLLHESCTLQEVQRWVGTERSRLAFTSVLLLMNVDPLDRLPPLGLRMGRPRYFANATYPLGINVTPGEQIMVEMLYDGRYFTLSQVQKLQAAFAAAIACIVEARGLRVGDLLQQVRMSGRQQAGERRNALICHLAAR